MPFWKLACCVIFRSFNYCLSPHFSDFRCPEKNGFFADLEQCDLYYECVDDLPEPKLCPDGLLFEDGNPNHEKCDYPFNVDCGAREFVREYLTTMASNSTHKTMIEPFPFLQLTLPVEVTFWKYP